MCTTDTQTCIFAIPSCCRCYTLAAVAYYAYCALNVAMEVSGLDSFLDTYNCSSRYVRTAML